jgi:hypothetical protein
MKTLGIFVKILFLRLFLRKAASLEPLSPGVSLGSLLALFLPQRPMKRRQRQGRGPKLPQ